MPPRIMITAIDDLDRVGENPEVEGKVVRKHLSLRIRYLTINVPTIPASL